MTVELWILQPGHEWGREVWDSDCLQMSSSVWDEKRWNEAEEAKNEKHITAKLTSFALPSVEQVIDGNSEPFSLFFTSKVETDLTGLKGGKLFIDITEISQSHKDSQPLGLKWANENVIL